MARMRRNFADFVSGKLGNVVFVTNGKKSYVRSIPHREKNSWSEAQVLYRNRISRVAALWRSVNSVQMCNIWNKATDAMNGYAWFVKKNMPAFSIDGTVIDPSLLFVSDGSLIGLQNSTASKAPGTELLVNVSWDNDEHLKSERLNDRIWAVSFYEGRFSSLLDTGLVRSDKQGSFLLPLIPYSDAPASGELFLYLFTSTADEKFFSTSKYFKI